MPRFVASRELLIAVYTGGMCDAMALALHRELGLPLGLIGYYDQEEDEEESPGEEIPQACHAFVYANEEKTEIIDAYGRRPIEQALVQAEGTAHWLDPGAPEKLRTWHRESSLDEVKHAFEPGDGVKDEDIEKAVVDARALNLLPMLAPRIHSAEAPSFE